jgi:16S rRNA (adenine1518-N6/adenine1519-N6)-dimethyltransferase
MGRHHPRKRFGQHFLHDRRVIEQLIGVIAPARDETLIEIGPGLGALTVPLLERQANLIVVELDRDLIAHLQNLKMRYPGLTVLNQDALTLDLARISHHPSTADADPLAVTNAGEKCGLAREKIRIVGNLPYNISSPLLFHFMDQGEYIRSMTFMLQQEVVDRICAEPNQSDYSRLSVMTQYYCTVEKRFNVDAAAFSPPPKVMSSVITLVPETDIDSALFASIVKQAFSQRRKILKNNLGQWLDTEDYLQLGISPGQRAQELTLQQFKAMTRHMMSKDQADGEPGCG